MAYSEYIENVKKTRFFKSLKVLWDNVLAFVKQCLSAKKILIISDRGISSVPMSTRTQGVVVAVSVVFMLWVSYSTGKYFAYEDVINKKDREIWNSSVAKENLQFQVTDLHQNLADLNHYFDNIRHVDQLATKDVFDTNQTSASKVSAAKQPAKKAQDSSDSEGNVQKLLFNIREKVLERIGSLENVVDITGVKVPHVAAYNDDLKDAMRTRDSMSNPQGGPFIPVEGAEISKELFEADVRYLIELEKLVHTLPLSAPMQRYWVSSRYGKRLDPIRGIPAMHRGIDLVGRHRSQVLASAPGVVTFARPYGAYGKFVEIDHGSGFITRYGHLEKIFVRVGQEVKRGQMVALQGSTGRSTGAHLHYEVRYNNKPIDPANFIRAGKYVF